MKKQFISYLLYTNSEGDFIWQSRGKLFPLSHLLHQLRATGKNVAQGYAARESSH